MGGECGFDEGDRRGGIVVLKRGVVSLGCGEEAGSSSLEQEEASAPAGAANEAAFGWIDEGAGGVARAGAAHAALEIEPPADGREEAKAEAGEARLRGGARVVEVNRRVKVVEKRVDHGPKRGLGRVRRRGAAYPAQRVAGRFEAGKIGDEHKARARDFRLGEDADLCVGALVQADAEEVHRLKRGKSLRGFERGSSDGRDYPPLFGEQGDEGVSFAKRSFAHEERLGVDPASKSSPVAETHRGAVWKDR